ncbi:MAG: hypothetical protein A2V67_20095 [Deltaproteobacteria bacterium RBG_13_61_14]|nr:MAG: hypothetical protein A2V67_20095 [Deltaproteobacteria bacterium RBG_13_61_14]
MIPLPPEEEPKRPSLVKQILPWVITVAIFSWIFRSVDFGKVWTEMQRANLWILIPAMAGLVGVQVWSEIWTFGTSYRWFADRHPTAWQIGVARVGTYPVQVLLAPLAAVVMLVYLVRVYKMRLALVFASDAFVVFIDLLQGAISLAAAVLIASGTGLESLHWFFYAFAAWNLVFYILWFTYWRTALKDRLWPKFRDIVAFQSFRVATWSQFGKMFLMRLPWCFGNLISMYLCLVAFDIRVPLAVFLIAAPLIMGMAFQPVSVGGYGGPQALAILFFKGYAAEEVILAQSLLWSTFYALFRLAAGLVFLYPFLKGFYRTGGVAVAAAPSLAAAEPAGAED